MASSDEKEVGYKKPPKKHQFKKGTSGNPSGRRKNAKGFDTILAEVLRRRITFTLNGERSTITVLDALVQVLIKFANAGSLPHIALAQEFDVARSGPRVIWFEKGDEKL